MNYIWKQNNQNKLIVFFNGWGCDEFQFDHLKTREYDVLQFNDYRSLSLPKQLQDQITSYSEINVIGWSYGVWVGEYVWEKHQFPIHKAMAINGTPIPLHDKYGIPEAITLATLEHLTEKSMMKFQRRMAGGSEGWQRFEIIKPQRTFEEQKEELVAIIQYFKEYSVAENFYKKVVVGAGDLIFSPQNQKAYWQGKVEVKEINEPHYCFGDYSFWDDLLEK